MERIKIAVRKDVAKKLQEAQNIHNLPINLTVGRIFNGMVQITFEYDEEDELLAKWFTENLVDKYSRSL